MIRNTLCPFVLKVLLVGLCSPVQGVLGDVDSNVQEPVILGYGENTFELGPVIHADALDDADRFAENWVVQMSKKDPDIDRFARIQDGRLHIHHYLSNYASFRLQRER
jgi:hypothetical protein